MKRISFLCFVLLTGLVRAEDAATTERLDKLNGYIQDLQESNAAVKKQMAEMAKEIQSLREQLAKPSGNYASAEDLRKLAETVKEIDKKREADNKRIVKEIENLGKSIGSGTPPKKIKPTPTTTSNSGTNSVGGGPENVYEYTIQKDDTLGAIVKAYKEKGIKVTVDQIVKVNPGLNPNNMPVGRKIVIPAPQ